jgi:peroxiredoxin Q/BCP
MFMPAVPRGNPGRKRITPKEDAMTHRLTTAAALLAVFCGFGFRTAVGVVPPEGSKPIERTPDRLVAVGSPAPDFSLPDASGKQRRLKELLDRPLVLYFYPADFTSGCTTEACSFRDDSPRYDSLGVRVVGISVDDPASHAKFTATHQLPFLLLSDPTGLVAELYGCAMQFKRSNEVKPVARRVTYLIDGKGIVRKVWPKVDPSTNSTEVLAAIAEIFPVKP